MIEQADLDGACGRAFNTGIGGARTRHVAYAMPALPAASRPATVVIDIGANHFSSTDECSEFAADYPAFVQSLCRGGIAHPKLAMVELVDSPRASLTIREPAVETGAQYVAPVLGPMRADGSHHTSVGSRQYRVRTVR